MRRGGVRLPGLAACGQPGEGRLLAPRAEVGVPGGMFPGAPRPAAEAWLPDAALVFSQGKPGEEARAALQGDGFAGGGNLCRWHGRLRDATSGVGAPGPLQGKGRTCGVHVLAATMTDLSAGIGAHG